MSLALGGAGLEWEYGQPPLWVAEAKGDLQRGLGNTTQPMWLSYPRHHQGMHIVSAAAVFLQAASKANMWCSHQPGKSLTLCLNTANTLKSEPLYM